jgi:amidase
MDAVELAYAGIARQAELIAAGEVSSRELVELYLERIARFDPSLNAYRVVLAERALLEADQADARRVGGERRPLLGVPIAVKEEFDVAGEVTTFGTNAYDGPAEADSELVRRARAAGAIVIGKTHMPELGAVPWTESPTWGATRNPWALERSPGGSSGGSAAAVAAGLIGAGLAGDGGGSIRFPAAYCGLFGLKTQRGRMPLAPHADAYQGLAVSGVITRSVADSALFYDAVAEGPLDAGAPTVAQAALVATLAGDSPPAKLRVAVSSRLPPSPLTRLHADNSAALAQTAQLLESLGHDVAEHEIDHGPIAPAPEFTARFLAGLREVSASLEHPERLERRLRTYVRLGGLLGPTLLARARAHEHAYAARLNSVFAGHDVVITPVTPAPPPLVGACEGRGWLWTLLVAASTVPYAACWNTTGQPACSVPAGFDADGLPRAVQLVGRAGDEATLVSLAAQLERERPWTQQRPPQFS